MKGADVEAERVAIVTGAGRGLGRAHALALAATGHAVVVNDRGGAADGAGSDATPAEQVAAEIRALGGQAVADASDVADFDKAGTLVDVAIETFGRLDVLVNNAGVVRDRMFANMTPEEWDAVIRVHLRGTFSPTRHAVDHWRELSKGGTPVDARVINTASPSGLYGNVGQTNYGAAKAGIAMFTVIASLELARYGVTVNCVAPAALTRLTEGLIGEITDDVREAMHPRWIANVVAWLAGPDAKDVTGRVFDVRGKDVAVVEGWHIGPCGEQPDEPSALAGLLHKLVDAARPNANMSGRTTPA